MPITKEVVLEVRYTTDQVKETDKVTLKAEVIRNEFIPAQVFLFQETLDGESMFCAVAAVADIGCFPTTQPGDGSPFFRLDNVCLEFDSAKAMKEVLESLRAQICQLASDYQILVCELESVFTETYNGTEGC